MSNADIFYILSYQSAVYRGGIFSPFMQMYLSWGPSTWGLASGCPPPPYSVSFSSIYRNTDHWLLLLSISQKKASAHSLVITGEREELRSDQSIQVFEQ